MRPWAQALTLLLNEFVSCAVAKTLVGVRRKALVPALSVLWWRVDVLRIFEPSVAMLFSTPGEVELVRDANFGFLFGDGELWWAFDRVRLAIQFFTFFSTGISSSLLISIGSGWLFVLDALWRFNLFVDAVFALVAVSAVDSVNSSCRLLNFRFVLLLSVVSNASVACFFLPRRFECADSKFSNEVYNCLLIGAFLFSVVDKMNGWLCYISWLHTSWCCFWWYSCRSCRFFTSIICSGRFIKRLINDLCSLWCGAVA